MRRCETRLALGKCAPDLHLAPNLHKRHHSPKHNTICCCRCCRLQTSATLTPLFDKCQPYAHRYSTNANGTRTATRQKSAAYTPLYSTKFSGTRTAIRQMSAVYTPLYSTRSTCTAIYTCNACLRTHFRDTYPQQISSLPLAAAAFVALYSFCC